MKSRAPLALAAFALSAVCIGLLAGPLANTKPGSAVVFLGAILLAMLGTGLLKPSWTAYMLALAVYVVAGPLLFQALPQSDLRTWALVFLGLPTVLIVSADLVTSAFKKAQERRFQRRYFGTR